MDLRDDGVLDQARSAGFRPATLDALNFLVADVRGALGPYLNVFLVIQQHWRQTDVGWVTTLSGLAGLAMQTPVGALIDASRRKRAAIVLALGALGAGAVVIFAVPTLWPVLIANTVMAMVGDVFGPAVAALTLGLYVRTHLAGRMGRNSAFDHAGNVAVAVAAGAVGYIWSQRAVFLLVPILAGFASIATLAIPRAAIDHERARGLDDEHDRARKPNDKSRAGEPNDESRAREPDDESRAREPDDASCDGSSAHPSPAWRALLRNRPLRVFALCILLFHFANAPLLPLVGQKLAQTHPAWATAMMSACIVAAQLIMLPIALAVGHRADRLGRKPILLAGFAVLPVRAVLYTLSDDTAWLIGIQILDGVGAGILGALTPLVTADVTRGSGRYNVAQGAVATAQGLGASLSGLAIGVVVDHLGYTPAFLGLGAAACCACAVLLLAMPETAADRGGRSPDRS